MERLVSQSLTKWPWNGLTFFGGVSSPSCSNYALKKTTNDSKLKYGLIASDTLNKKFYVDDILKSVASFPEAITLGKKC